MAPPTRHSSRIGNAGLSTLSKEDENAGANLAGRPTVGKVLRGRKEPTMVASTAPVKTLNANSKTSTASTNNARKRILDDRTNNVKTNSLTVNPANSKTAANKTAPLTRKASITAASKKNAMVLDEVKPTEAPSRRTIKPIRKDAPARTTASRKASASNASHNVDPAEPAGPSARVGGASQKGTNSTAATRSRRPAQRATGRVTKGTTHGTTNEADDAGHVAKKIRTSEPDEIQKENQATNASRSERAQKKEITKGLTKGLAATTRSKVVSHSEKKLAEQDWDDLDEGDEDDPLMVREYVAEIYQYMRELELETLPDLDYMSRQNELTWKMRGVLVDWIIEVHSKFRLLPETLFLAINLMDRFLTKRSVALIKFQLVGVTALFLAAKYEEVICPSVTNFLYMTDGGYDCDEILKAETYMLEMLNWDLRYPNPLNFLRRVSKADSYDIQSRTFAKYFMEISIVDYRLVATPPSLLGATSLWLARKLLGRGAWNANLIHYSGYQQAEILPVAQIMLDYILRSGCKNLGMGLDPNFVGQAGYEGGNEHGNLFKKYATRKFFRVSEIVRDWAVDRYTYETPTGYEWDKLEEWNSQAVKKATSSSRRARQVQAEYDDDDEEDEEDEDEDVDLDDQLLMDHEFDEQFDEHIHDADADDHAIAYGY